MRRLIPVISLALIFMLACEETEEGCLDLLAENFSFEAVNACDSCCLYPTLNLRLELMSDTLDYSFSDTLVLDSDDSLTINTLQLVFSDFSFISAGQSYKIEDSLHNEDLSIKDDFVFFEAMQTRTLGNTRFEDELGFIDFRAGFDENRVRPFFPPSSIDQDSRLDLALDSLYLSSEDELLAGKCIIKWIQSGSIDTIQLSNNQINGGISFESDRFVAAGQDWQLKIILDVDLLLEGINSTFSSVQIANVMVDNLYGSVRLE